MTGIISGTQNNLYKNDEQVKEESAATLVYEFHAGPTKKVLPVRCAAILRLGFVAALGTLARSHYNNYFYPHKFVDPTTAATRILTLRYTELFLYVHALGWVWFSLSAHKTRAILAALASAAVGLLFPAGIYEGTIVRVGSIYALSLVSNKTTRTYWSLPLAASNAGALGVMLARCPVLTSLYCAGTLWLLFNAPLGVKVFVKTWLIHNKSMACLRTRLFYIVFTQIWMHSVFLPIGLAFIAVSRALSIVDLGRDSTWTYVHPLLDATMVFYVVLYFLSCVYNIVRVPVSVRQRMQDFCINNHPLFFGHATSRYESKEALDPGKQHIYLFHPHGITALGWGLFTAHKELRHMNFCIAESLMQMPFFKLFLQLFGKPIGAGRRSLEMYLGKGESVGILPGGFHEATLSCTSKDRVYIKKRFGIFNLAAKYQVPVVPVYGFGERLQYRNVQGGWAWRFWLNDWGIPSVLFWGRFPNGLLPRPNQPMHIVIGKEINPPSPKETCQVSIANFKKLYEIELCSLYDRYKKDFYGKTFEDALEVW